MEKGYFHVYTGDGKGKSTAAFGLALRALCAGKRVYIGQFVKNMKYSETKIENMMDGIKIIQFGKDCCIDRAPDEEDKRLALSGLHECANILRDGKYDLVILDEVTIATYLKFIEPQAVLDAIKGRANHVEVVVTGRYCPELLMDHADLVTEMKEVKHYYSQGVLSREGIDC